ncbi:MAG TPA: lysophospholipid acyltransferase family protein [Steroidobacteraceae bacterium]|nr:lysophospholipid acyltransferase family protein [Steroidobacteraceae bacterium]
MLRVMGRALGSLYGLCALAIFCLMFALAALLAVIVPRLRWRRTLTHQLARVAVVLFGLRLSTTGLERLPSGSCVVVANHESYLDGVLLKAVLPPRFSFVIKREAASLPVAGFLLRRIGSVFVDRNTRGGRQRDARRVLEHAELGHSLVFFPEGTFDETAGLKRFHVGAFTAAVRGGMPLVPVVIRGARRAMPPGAYFPRAGRIELEVLDPLPADGPDVSADRLRDEARRRMLARLDLPDLAAGPPSPHADVDAGRNPA